MPEITRQNLDKHVNRRLRMRVRLYLGISVLILLAIGYRVWADGGGIAAPLFALFIGIGVGVLLSRMFAITWDVRAEQVVSRMDIYGAILLTIYIVFELTGEHF